MSDGAGVVQEAGGQGPEINVQPFSFSSFDNIHCGQDADDNELKQQAAGNITLWRQDLPHIVPQQLQAANCPLPALPPHAVSVPVEPLQHNHVQSLQAMQRDPVGSTLTASNQYFLGNERGAPAPALSACAPAQLLAFPHSLFAEIAVPPPLGQQALHNIDQVKGMGQQQQQQQQFGNAPPVHPPQCFRFNDEMMCMFLYSIPITSMYAECM